MKLRHRILVFLAIVLFAFSFHFYLHSPLSSPKPVHPSAKQPLVNPNENHLNIPKQSVKPLPSQNKNRERNQEAQTPSSYPLLIINLQSNELAYYKNGMLIKTFSIASGKPATPTPQGIYKIANKIKNRPYYKEHIAGGDPKNPLGDRWMGLSVNPQISYAIHGNNNENSIGQHVSSGCIRMHNEEVRWLYDQITVQTTVIITKTDKTFPVIAGQYGYVTRQ
ncbi:L,D-transpeptidase [Fictibacillus terranigra]|uniref:L,D-transpeptidase n=1 Tax=Fictibacillus terranigra TaxID=3058424 RepID=A0ABT8E2U4_9BACL|nr:L,D-transpeptidase [Fictibacillus sp. CENA-BCM004]MDN4072232.1 L,D-transpeptidase [Fictibacillus sp. CENA-BCM004]